MDTTVAMRRPRMVFTVQDDVLLLRETLAVRMFERAGSKEQTKKWETVEARLATSGVQATAESLRRRVNELTKKYRKDGGAAVGRRMRWGLEWPKSDDDIERDSLLKRLIEKIDRNAHPKPAPNQRKTNVARGTCPPSMTSPAEVTLVALNASVNPSKVDTTKAEDCSRRDRISMPIQTLRVSPSSALDIDSVSLKDSNTLQPLDRHEDHGPAPISFNQGKPNITQQQLEMEEGLQHRMLDLQSEQVKLMHEQVQIQREMMRTLPQAVQTMQAIARAIHALESQQRRR